MRDDREGVDRVRDDREGVDRVRDDREGDGRYYQTKLFCELRIFAMELSATDDVKRS